MEIKFWGTRGSCPTPSTADFATGRYGGNTTCVSIRVPDQLIILDGGSGLRSLGLALRDLSPCKATFFFTHVHWDHIQGFPFFKPTMVPGNEFDLYGERNHPDSGVSGNIIENALYVQQRSLNFPIQISDLPATLQFHEISEGDSVQLRGSQSDLVITSCKLNHPGGCLGYRVEERRGNVSKAFVFATDTEHKEDLSANLQALAKDADVLVHDAQYTPGEYAGQTGEIPRKGWGHSTWYHGIREALNARVKRLILTHHDPMHDDWAIASLENEARKEGAKVNLEVDAAKEGMEIIL